MPEICTRDEWGREGQEDWNVLPRIKRDLKNWDGHCYKSKERVTAAVKTPSSSILVLDSDCGLPEEVVQEMERASVLTCENGQECRDNRRPFYLGGGNRMINIYSVYYSASKRPKSARAPVDMDHRQALADVYIRLYAYKTVMLPAFEFSWTRYTRLWLTRKGNVLEQVDYDSVQNSVNNMAACLNEAITTATLHVQDGDVTRLRVELDKVHAFMADAERARNVLEQEEYDSIQDSVNTMAACLNKAITAAVGDPIPLAQLDQTGPGRPRIDIDKNWLSYASQRITLQNTGELLHCSARTVRRRLLDYHLAEPAPPVIQEVVQPDGTVAREWHSTRLRFDFKDQPARLDELVRGIVNRFPNYGLDHVRAALKSRRHRVARDDARASLRRVRGLQLR
ncbi:hypothetical protein F5887DRAFT_1192174 [Amanita rubescens]|nr:hypothetical protein F5887DRAFT_1192174 [Amanita rubescens]